MQLPILRKIFLYNELGNNENLIYRFSTAGGRSGYSFGLCQFDINHNPLAILCLRQCEFTTDEIMGLKHQTIPTINLSSRLLKHKSIIDRWDNDQINECSERAVDICARSSIDCYPSTLYHLADYHNQLYLSINGKMHMFLKSLKRKVMPRDVLKFKLSIYWGRIRPDDVHRRYNNIQEVLSAYPQD